MNNSIAYFVTYTRYCGKTKLFKLLYFLDFQHYCSTGRNVTGLEYFAWPKGPVPVEIFDQLDNSESPLRQSFSISHRIAANGHKMMDVTPTFDISFSNFSKRETRLLKELAAKYKYTYANDMIEETHLENKPWDKIYNQQKAKQELIPYDLAIKDSENREVNSAAVMSSEFRDNYK